MMYMSLGDQPERRGSNSLTMGNSRTHARWRHACDFNQLLDVLPACDSCFQFMLDAERELRINGVNIGQHKSILDRCVKCTNWAQDFSHELLRFERSKFFPKDYMLGAEEGNGPLVPIVVTYSVVERVLSLTFNKVVSGLWSKTQAITYLTDNCINESYGEVFVNRAENINALNTAKSDTNDFTSYRTHLNEKKNQSTIHDLTYHLYIPEDTCWTYLWIHPCISYFLVCVGRW